MRRLLPIISVAMACLVAASTSLAKTETALATTETAHNGTVAATFTFNGKVPNFHGLHLTIARAGTVVYDQPVVAKFCGKLCWPGSSADRRSAVQVINHDHTS